MNECRIRTGRVRLLDDVGDAGTLTNLRIELHRSAGLLLYDATLDEFGFSESTAQYPAGLREDLCRLSACRPPVTPG
jgi:hypothetical protein